MRRGRSRRLKMWSALYPYLGGKRRLCPLIFREIDRVVPRRLWPSLTFLDAFLGGGSVSLGAKAAKPKAPKELKPKKEKVPKEPLVVFAFRLSEADRDIIHKAAGPGKATRFVRSAALAAANADVKSFEALVTQARSNLK